MRLKRHLLLGLFLVCCALPSANACDGSGYVINDLIDNGDGTWTLDITVHVAGADWGGGILGGTRGFDFSTDAATILNVSPTSLTSANGTTLNSVIAGNTVSWGDPDAGAYFVQGFENTQTFDVTLTLSEEPTVWAGGGMENGNCPTGFPGALPGPVYMGVFNNFEPPPLCENMPDLAINSNTTITDNVFLSGAADPLGSSTTIDAICVLIEHTWIGDLTLSLTSPEGTTVVLSQTNGGSANDYGDVLGGTYMCFTSDALFDVDDYTGGSTGAYLPDNSLSNFDGENPNGSWTLTVTDGASGDEGTLISWGIAFSTGMCDCEAPMIDIPAVDPVCVGESITITANAVAAESISWSTGGSGTSITITANGNQQITATASNACGDATASVDISVLQPPTLDPIPDQTACQGDLILLSAFAQNEDNILWSTGASGANTSHNALQTEIITATASNSCGSVTEQMTLTVDPPPQITVLTTDLSICAGETIVLEIVAEHADDILWSTFDAGESAAVTPDVTTTYQVLATNDCGFDEVDITVTVLPPPELNWVQGDQTICEGQSATLEVDATNADLIEWSDLSTGPTASVTPNTTTTYTVTAFNNCGQDDLEATVTVSPPFEGTAEVFACQGSTINYGGTILSAGDTAVVLLTTAAGCDSLVTVTVGEGLPSSSQLELQACPGDSALYQGQLLAVGDTMDFVLTNAVGCDSTVTVIVMEAPTFTSTQELFTCEGGFVTYQGVDLLPGDTTDFVLTAMNGCDSTVTVIIGAQPAPQTELELFVCPGDSVVYAGTTFGAGASQLFALVDPVGCDSFVQVSVTELPTFSSDEELFACPGDSVLYAGQMLPSGSVQDFTLAAENGCDSVVTVMVSTLPTFTSTLELFACPGDSATYDGFMIAEGSSQDFFLQAQNGCDSILTVSVAALPTYSSSVELMACPGDSVAYAGTLIAEGDSQDFTLTAQNGCDSVVTVSVAALPTFSSSLELMACPGDSAAYAGSMVAEGDTQDFILTAANGCDSTVTVSVSALPTSSSDLILYSCPGETATYQNVDLNIGENQAFTLIGSNGCDSIVTVSVEALPTFSSNLSLESCAGIPISYEGTDLFPGQTQDFTLQAQNGCDSVVTVTVNEIENIETNLELSTCPGSSITYEGVALLPGDSMDFSFMSAAGCDSIVHLSIAALPTFASDLEFAICPDEVVTYEGTTLLPGTTQDFTLSAQNGCDSVVTVTVEALPTFSSGFSVDLCPDEVFTYEGVDLFPGDSHAFTLNASNGCDSTVTVTINSLPTFASDLEFVICPDETVTYEGVELAPGTVQDFILPAINGCDSIVTVMVDALPAFASDLALSACPGSSVTYEGVELFPGEEQAFTLLAENGCDSVVTVMVDELPTFSSSLQLSTCEGSTVDYDGVSMAPGDTGIFTFPAINGCDSLVTVSVSALPIYAETLPVQACEGGAYDFFGTMIPAGQTQVFNLATIDGCDSIITVAVAEVNHITTQSTARICSGESIELFGDVVQQAGNYSATYTSAQGCDSTHTITLSLDALPTPSFTSEASCADVATGSIQLAASGGQAPYSYMWEDGSAQITHNDLPGGNYSVTVTDDNGCSRDLVAQVDEHHLDLRTEVIDISCFGAQDGLITVSTPGSEANFSLDGHNFAPDNTFSQLGPGIYEIYAQDIYGCQYEAPSLIVNEPNEFFVVLPPDTTIQLSDEIYVPAQTNRLGDSISYFWTPTEYLDCGDCPRPLASPLYTTRYRVVATDSNGCTGEDDITIFVDRRRKVYIPNGFSPNGDGINDIFYIFSDASVKQINSFLIFNRWGEPVFEVYDSHPNNPQWGWDGNFRGQLMNPAVFAYFAEIEFVDGEVEIFKGDVTLVR